MSWDSYIDTLSQYAVDKSGQSHLDSGAIIGLNGAKWTTDTHAKALKVDANQAMVIGQAFTSENFQTFIEGGIKVADVSYMFLRQEKGQDGVTVLGKKKEKGSIVLASTKTAIVIGHCPEGQQQGTASVAVGKIVDYLVQQGI